MDINETLSDYNHSIENSLAGFLTNKPVEELEDADLDTAKEIVEKLSTEKYFALADALDREDFEGVSEIINVYDAGRPMMGESIKPIAESGYMDADLFLKEGFTYFGIFEDEKLRNNIAKYLDENEVEYMDCGDGHLQMKFVDREHAYRAESAISRMVARSNPHYVRDDVEMEARKPFPDPGKKHRRFGKPKSLGNVGGKNFKKLQKKNGGNGCFDSKMKEEDVEEAKKGTRKFTKDEKPYNVRSGGPSQSQSGAGYHTEPTKQQEIDKRERKHKKNRRNFEELEMSKERIEEGVLGMIDIPSINRMRHLAGLGPIQEAEKSVGEREELDEALPVSMDDSPLMREPEDDMADIGDPIADDADEFAGPVGDETPDGAMDTMSDMDPDMDPDMDLDMGHDMDGPETTDIVPTGDSMGGMGDVRSEIEASINDMLAKAPELKISDYKDVLNRVEDAVAQMRAMGAQYLKEGKKTETLREWAVRQTGFRKAYLSKFLAEKDKKFFVTYLEVGPKSKKGSVGKTKDKTVTATTKKEAENKVKANNPDIKITNVKAV